MNKQNIELLESFLNVIVAIVLFSIAIQVVFVDSSVFSTLQLIALTIFSLSYALFAYRDKVKTFFYKEDG